MDEGCPKLLDLIPKEKEWLTESLEQTINGVSEENKLELTLAPPGSTKESNTFTSRERPNSLSHFPTSPSLQNPILTSPSPSPWEHKLHSSYLHLQSGERQIAVKKESSQPCSNRAAEQSPKKAFSAALHSSSSTAQKRTAPTQVVGWPPIRLSRKNIASSSSSKPETESPINLSTPKSAENCAKSPFVKINMEGIPIGRKVDLSACNSYEKLASAVDELFKGLLAAQDEGGKEMGGLLDGSGEYTLAYEDNEGERMLVADVPWDMFASTVKRLRVLKSSELPAISRGSRHGSSPWTSADISETKLCLNINF